GVVAGNNSTPVTDNSGVGSIVQGTHGKLVLGSDGTYTYTRDTSGALTATDVFSYTLKDGDNDTSVTTLTISISDSGTTLTDLTPATGNGDTTVDEKGLPPRSGEPAGSGEIADGNGANNSDTTETNTGSFSISAPDGLQSVTINGVTVIDTNGALTGNAV